MKMILLAIAISILGMSRAQAQFNTVDPQNLVTTQVLANVSAIKPGEPFMIGVLFKITPDYHIYWTNPGDSGLPTTVKLDLPAGFTAGAVQYPVPARLTLPGDIINYAYENEVMLLIPITPPKQITDKTVTISGKASWLVCKDDCTPGHAKLSVELPVADNSAADNTELFAQWTSKLPSREVRSDDIQTGTSNCAKAGDALVVTVRVEWAAMPTDVAFIPDAGISSNVSSLKVTTEGKVSTVTFTVKDTTAGAPLTGLITYTDKAGQRVGYCWSVLATDGASEKFGGPKTTAAGLPR